MPGNTYYSQGWPSDRNHVDILCVWHLNAALADANLDVYGAQGVADNTHGKKSLETHRAQVPRTWLLLQTVVAASGSTGP